MRFAILSDIHANLEALEAVLADARAQDCTHFVCLGDVVGYNANPHECVELIQELECPVVKGNHDEQASIVDFDRGLQRAGRGSDRLDARTSYRRRQGLAARSAPNDGRCAISPSSTPPSIRRQQWGYVFNDLDAIASFTYQHTTALLFRPHPWADRLRPRR